MRRWGNFYSVLMAVCLALFLLQGEAAAAGRYYLTDNGVKVWNPSPQAGESVTWVGGTDQNNCASGEGTLTWYQNGKRTERFVGTLVWGRINGNGTFTRANGSSSTGYFIEGTRIGGIAKFQTLDLRDGRYEGYVIDGQLCGFGKMVYKNGKMYVGDWINGIRTGPAYFTWPDGSSYDGWFDNDCMEGQGTYAAANGDVYQGRYHRDRLEGQGVLTCANGDRYEGSFVDGHIERHGGVWLLATGERIEKDFVDVQKPPTLESLLDRYTVDTQVEVIRWGSGYGFGYGAIVKDVDGSNVTLEITDFINTDNYVPASLPSGGERLVRGRDEGREITVNIRAITGYYGTIINFNKAYERNKREEERQRQAEQGAWQELADSL